MIKECIYTETTQISQYEAAEFFYHKQMLGTSDQADEDYASYMEKMMGTRNQEIGSHLPDGRFPVMETAILGISAFKKNPVVICDLD